MPIATIRSPMATGICRSETRGIVNTVSVNGMFRRKTTILKKSKRDDQVHDTWLSSGESSKAKRQARAAPRRAKFRSRSTKLKLGRQRPKVPGPPVKGAIAERENFSALLRMLRAAITLEPKSLLHATGNKVSASTPPGSLAIAGNATEWTIFQRVCSNSRKVAITASSRSPTTDQAYRCALTQRQLQLLEPRLACLPYFRPLRAMLLDDRQ